jgi:hypothetical protein
MMKFWLIKVASAQILPSRLVPECNPTGATASIPACDECFLAQMGHNIIMTLVYAAFVIVVIMTITGGFRLLFQGGNPEGRQKAKKHITSSIIGLLIVLLSWTGLNIFFTKFTNLQGDWWALERLECEGTKASCIEKCSVRYQNQAEIDECESQCPGN